MKIGFRGHEVINDPLRRNTAIVIGRRPGQFLVRFDTASLIEIVRREVETNRQFNGHGVFSPNGKIFYTSEHDLVSGKGLIGVRHSDTFVKYAEFDSHGVGPHGLLLEPDGTLLIANGGILGIPAAGPTGAATSGMDPSLVRLNTKNGRLVGQWRLSDALLSVRHLARAADGKIGIALQAVHGEQALRESAPIFALFDGVSLKASRPPKSINLGGYAGDVASIRLQESSRFALGCSHSGVIAWYESDGSLQGTTPLRNACAVSLWKNFLIAATESGEAVCIPTSGNGDIQVKKIDIEWENHLLVLSPGVGSRV